MNHDKALQMIDKTWNYTRSNDNQNRTYPIGYCASFINKTDDYHKHATKEQAEECYKKYELDNNLQLNAGTVGERTQFKCECCEEWTNIATRIGGWETHYLCDEHRNRETMESIFTVGESFHS